jgi:hypothetical protein
VPEQLHGHLQQLLSPIIHDDGNYDDAFDEFEVPLGIIVAYTEAQTKRNGQNLHGSLGGCAYLAATLRVPA